MTMRLSTSVLAISLFLVSPAFAGEPKNDIPAKEAAPVCRTADAKKIAADQQDGTAVEYELTGDALKNLNDLVAKKGTALPSGMDRLLVLSKPGSPVWAGVIFVNGCISQIFPIRPESFKKLLDLSKDDGSI